VLLWLNSHLRLFLGFLTLFFFFGRHIPSLNVFFVFFFVFFGHEGVEVSIAVLPFVRPHLVFPYLVAALSASVGVDPLGMVVDHRRCRGRGLPSIMALAITRLLSTTPLLALL
jgi:hypothetical protein